MQTGAIGHPQLTPQHPPQQATPCGTPGAHAVCGPPHTLPMLPGAMHFGQQGSLPQHHQFSAACTSAGALMQNPACATEDAGHAAGPAGQGVAPMPAEQQQQQHLQQQQQQLQQQKMLTGYQQPQQQPTEEDIQLAHEIWLQIQNAGREVVVLPPAGASNNPWEGTASAADAGQPDAGGAEPVDPYVAYLRRFDPNCSNDDLLAFVQTLFGSPPGLQAFVDVLDPQVG